MESADQKDTIDYTKTHGKAMKLLEEAGIQVLIVSISLAQTVSLAFHRFKLTFFSHLYLLNIVFTATTLTAHTLPRLSTSSSRL